MWEEFPQVSTAEWEKAIQADLKGADYDKRLVWHADEGITVRPYYRRENLPGTTGQARFTGQWQVAKLPIFPRMRCAEICCTSREQRRYRKSDTHWRNRGKTRTFRICSRRKLFL